MGQYRILSVELVFVDDGTCKSVLSTLKHIIHLFEIDNAIELSQNNIETSTMINHILNNREKELYNNFILSHELIQAKIYNCNDLYYKKKIDGDRYAKRMKEILSQPIYVFFVGGKELSFASIANCGLQKTDMPEFSKTPQYSTTIVRGFGPSVFATVSDLKIKSKNWMVGSSLSSLFSYLLHSNIREKEGLAYYAGSEYDKIGNKFFVKVGTYSKYFKYSKDYINEAQRYLERGWISSELLNQIKISKKNELFMIKDDPYMILALMFENKLINTDGGFPFLFSLINKLMISEIQEVAASLNFLLTVKVIGNEDEINVSATNSST